MTTDSPTSVIPPARRTAAAPARGSAGRRRPSSGPDRTSVLLFSTAAFLAVLALLAWQLRAGTGSTATRHQIVLRRIYRTTVIETVPGAGSGTSVSQSVSSSGATSSAPAPTTSSSHS